MSIKIQIRPWSLNRLAIGDCIFATLNSKYTLAGVLPSVIIHTYITSFRLQLIILTFINTSTLHPEYRIHSHVFKVTRALSICLIYMYVYISSMYYMCSWLPIWWLIDKSFKFVFLNYSCTADHGRHRAWSWSLYLIWNCKDTVS